MRSLLTAIGLFFIAAQLAAVQPEDPTQKKQALNSLRMKINQLKAEINKTEANKSRAVTALEQSESAISEATNMLRELQQRQILSQSQLDKINADIVRIKAHIMTSRVNIADLVRTRYQKGHYEAWRLILNQQNPNNINRDLHYYAYVASAQQTLANELKSQLLTLDRLSEEIRKKQFGLKSIYTQQQQQQEVLKVEKARKAAALVSLSKEVREKKSRLQRMLIDEKNLTYLVNRLHRLLQEEEKKRAREQALRDKAEMMERAHLANAQSATRLPSVRHEEMSQVVPPDKRARQMADEKLSGRAFAALKGRLHLPVSGAVVGRFGEQREEGSTWKGLFIRANLGQSVKAVADGKVVFAEWLRGFGNMIIVDHGGGYMSLYGQNENLVKRVGDRVKAGEGIAIVGDTGGSQEAGVYFEIRQHGRPQNPLKWASAV